MLIGDCTKAKENCDKVTLWGSGEITREFMYVKDIAKVIVKATSVYNETLPLNIGTGEEIKIKDLANLIADLIEYKSKICWDTTKNDGYRRKCLNNTRMCDIIPNIKLLSIKEGLYRTIRWAKKEDII